ncbi:MAG: trimethylamine methyltransferase family protein [Deltaproteobacteria bacterium]|nr:trimethylamine methyltransferase family protein [Deltaproteobacteria bacterium]MBW2120951.1 trimethylamine methyltransferase family protein [Deltaproteobacteria bacterium]
MRKGPVAGTEMSTGWGLKTLTQDGLEKIHAATLDVMQTTGISVGSDEALDILDKGGCWVNRKTQVVRFPPHIVKEALSTCPGRILLAGRDPADDFMMGGREVGFTTFGTGVLVVDPETGEVRPSTKHDMGMTALLADAMENVDVLTTPVAARDKPDSSYDLHMAEASFVNCSKHLHSDAEDGQRAIKIIEMASAIVGGEEQLKARPIVSLAICPTSPLQLIEPMAEVIIEAARHWIPIDVLSMAMAGASSPISLSGAMVTHNAEVLSGIVLAQLTSPGAPVIYGSSTTTFDMKRGTAVVGAPELGMISALVAELANYYNLPSYVAGG